MPTLECPTCSSKDLKLVDNREWECQSCGAILVEEPLYCPICGHGTTSGIEICTNCGEPLSIISQIMTRHTGNSEPYRLKQIRSQAQALKERDIEPSRRRMEKFQQIDRRREQAIAEAREAQAIYHRRISKVLLAIASMFILFVIAFVIMYLNP